MIKHSFSDFSYAVNIDSKKKKHKEVLVCYIYNGIEVLRRVYIPEKPGTAYIFEARKIIDQEIKDGTLAAYSHKFVARGKRRIVKASKPKEASSLVGTDIKKAPILQVGPTTEIKNEPTTPEVAKVEAKPEEKKEAAPVPPAPKKIKFGKTGWIVAAVAVVALLLTGTALTTYFVTKNAYYKGDFDVVFDTDKAISVGDAPLKVAKGSEYKCDLRILNPNYVMNTMSIYMGKEKLTESVEYTFENETLKISKPADGNIYIHAYSSERGPLEVTKFKYTKKTASDISIDELVLPSGYKMSDVTSVIIPENYYDGGTSYKVTEIKPGILNGCSNIKNISIPFVGKDINYTQKDTEKDTEHLFGTLFGNQLFDTVTTLTYQDYYDKQGGTDGESKHYLVDFAIPRTVEKVTITGDYNLPQGAFSNCTHLLEVAYNSSSSNAATEVGMYAFHGCRSLRSFRKSSSITTYAKSSFDNCLALYECKFDGITTIGDRAFAECSDLNDIYLSNSVSTVGHEAFLNFGGLIKCYRDSSTPSGWESDWVNETTPVIYNCSTENLPVLTDGKFQFLKLGDDEAYIYQYVGDINDDPIEIPDTLNDTSADIHVKHIGAYSFMDFNKTTTINIKCTQLETIENYAFANCSLLKTLTFTEDLRNNGTLEIIGSSAFANCVELTVESRDEEENGKTLFPNSVRKIGNKTFYNCQKLKALNLSGVKSVGSQAFEDCSRHSTVGGEVVYNPDPDNDLKWVKINYDFAGFGARCFLNCRSLEETKFDVPQTGKITVRDDEYKADIPEYCYCYTNIGAAKDGKITIPAYTRSINDAAFAYCPAIKEVVFESTTGTPSIENIGYSAFYACTNINTEITLPSSLKTFGESAFEECQHLTGIYCKSTNITVLPRALCYTCPYLRYFKFDSMPQLLKIDDYAFTDDQNLGYIGTSDNKLYGGIQYIGKHAFKNCVSLGQDLSSYSLGKPLGLNAPLNDTPNLTIGEDAFFGWYTYSNGAYFIVDKGWFNNLGDSSATTKWSPTWEITRSQQRTGYYVYEHTEGDWTLSLYISR